MQWHPLPQRKKKNQLRTPNPVLTYQPRFPPQLTESVQIMRKMVVVHQPNYPHETDTPKHGNSCNSDLPHQLHHQCASKRTLKLHYDNNPERQSNLSK